MPESRIKIFTFLILYNLPDIVNSQHLSPKKSWTYEMTDIMFKTNDPDYIDAEVQMSRVSRGVYGISGFVHIKQPVDETSSMEAIFYRDKYCQGNYERQLYSVGNTSFPDAMNRFYKRLLMDSLKNCAHDAPVFDSFEPPLTPRYVVLDNCQISTDNMPSHVDEGCYLASMNTYGQVEISFSAYVVVESKVV